MSPPRCFTLRLGQKPEDHNRALWCAQRSLLVAGTGNALSCTSRRVRCEIGDPHVLRLRA